MAGIIDLLFGYDGSITLERITSYSRVNDTETITWEVVPLPSEIEEIKVSRLDSMPSIQSFGGRKVMDDSNGIFLEFTFRMFISNSVDAQRANDLYMYSQNFISEQANFFRLTFDESNDSTRYECFLSLSKSMGNHIIDARLEARSKLLQLTSPLVITNFTIDSITTNSAQANWSTVKPSTTVIDYGTTSALGSTVNNATLVTSHSINIPSLLENTQYFVRATSVVTSTGETASSPIESFTTALSPLVFSNISSTTPTISTAVVTWDTNRFGSSVVRYGIASGTYTNTSTGPDATTGHSVNIIELMEDTQYFYVAETKELGRPVEQSSEQTFTTPEYIPLVISNVQVSSITQTSAVVTWDTDRLSLTWVNSGTISGGPYENTDGGVPATTGHTVTVDNLSAGTEYFFTANSREGTRPIVTSPEGSFETIPSNGIAISNVQSSLITSSTAFISWTTTINSSSIVRYGTVSGNYPNTETGDFSTNLNHLVELTGLSTVTQYFYVVESDDGGTPTVSDEFTFTTTTP